MKLTPVQIFTAAHIMKDGTPRNSVQLMREVYSSKDQDSAADWHEYSQLLDLWHSANKVRITGFDRSGMTIYQIEPIYKS